MVQAEGNDRRRGFAAANRELARRAVRTPAAVVLLGPAAVVAGFMIASTLWPSLRDRSDLFWGLIIVATVAAWFFGRLFYFAFVGVPAGGGVRTRRPWWLGTLLAVAGLVIAGATFVAVGLALGWYA